jgi:hypothetical protein
MACRCAARRRLIKITAKKALRKLTVISGKKG